MHDFSSGTALLQKSRFFPGTSVICGTGSAAPSVPRKEIAPNTKCEPRELAGCCGIIKSMFILEKLIGVVAPHVCVVCGDEGDVVCAWCLPDIAASLPARCYRCAKQTENSLVCRPCRRQSRLKHVWVRAAYEKYPKQLIHDFKFKRKQAAAAVIARLMAEALPYLPPDTLVVHVPTAPARVRQRGYDHAKLLAASLAKELGLTYQPLLGRSGNARQVGAKRAERLTQLKGAFYVAKPLPRQGGILLVDDLVTTGGTLEATATVLKKAGAKKVDAVVFAQKIL